jgi:hypothetical protein
MRWAPDEPSYLAFDALSREANHNVTHSTESAPVRLIEWNADSSTEEVLAAFDRAIEACS